MLTIEGPNAHRIVTVRVGGTITDDDFARIKPKIDEMMDLRHPVLVLKHIEKEWSITPSAIWEDLKIAPGFIGLIERTALVCESQAMRTTARALSAFVPFKVGCFEDEETATAWLRSADDASGVDVTCSVDDGIACIEVVVSDTFSIGGERKLEATLDGAAEDADQFRIVVRPHDFHGWEGMQALWIHLKLLHRHAHRFQRLAMVAEERWQRTLFRMGKTFFSAQMRRFAEGEEDQARAWAFSGDDNVS